MLRRGEGPGHNDLIHVSINCQNCNYFSAQFVCVPVWASIAELGNKRQSLKCIGAVGGPWFCPVVVGTIPVIVERVGELW